MVSEDEEDVVGGGGVGEQEAKEMKNEKLKMNNFITLTANTKHLSPITQELTPCAIEHLFIMLLFLVEDKRLHPQRTSRGITLF